MNDADRPLLRLLHLLAERRYRFVTISPASHGHVVARPDKQRARDLRDVFGWSLPFDKALLDPELFACLQDAEALQEVHGSLWRSRFRVSSLGRDLFLHSAYPTTDEDAVFFGPDTYRFAAFITAALRSCPPEPRLVDIGTGSGAGGVAAARACPGARLLLTDPNAEALRLARINAAAAGLRAETLQIEGLDGVEETFEIAVTNPPYVIDPGARTYRDGGDMHGAALSLELAEQAVARLHPGGVLLLYTGSAIIDGEDRLKRELARRMAERGCDLDYQEIDPDVFGEELAKPHYADVERLAVVGAVIRRRP